MNHLLGFGDYKFLSMVLDAEREVLEGVRVTSSFDDRFMVHSRPDYLPLPVVNSRRALRVEGGPGTEDRDRTPEWGGT